MKKRGMRSTDCADALALTFAEPLRVIRDEVLMRSSVVDRVAGY
jgi:hypothetical protein